MNYIAQVTQWVKEGKLYTVGDAALTSTDALGEAAAANHTSTKPSLLFFNSSGSGKTAQVMGLYISEAGTVAGGRPELMLAYDVGNRYSSGGAAVVPVNKKPGGGPSSLLCYQAQSASLITAGAATSACKYFNQLEIPETVTAADGYPGLLYPGTTGGILIPPGYSFLVYCRAATTGLTFHWFLEFLEESF